MIINLKLLPKNQPSNLHDSWDFIFGDIITTPKTYESTRYSHLILDDMPTEINGEFYENRS